LLTLPFLVKSSISSTPSNTWNVVTSLLPLQLSVVSHLVPRTVAEPLYPVVLKAPLALPQRWREPPPAAATALCLPCLPCLPFFFVPPPHLSGSFSAASRGASGAASCFAWNSPSQKLALSLAPVPRSSVTLTTPLRVSASESIGIRRGSGRVKKSDLPGAST